MKKILSLSVFAFFLFQSCSHRAPKPTVSDLPIVNSKKAVPQKRYKPRLVSIGLATNQDRIVIESKGTFTLVDLTDNTRHKMSAGRHTFTARSSAIGVGRLKLGSKVRLAMDNEKYDFHNSGKTYRGLLKLTAVSESDLNLVNQVDLDTYLKGVLPREVIVTWPKEALRAQAVASRTYLASHLGRHKKEGFDVCSQVHCQVYGGTAKEHPKTNQAVDDTRGEVLLYNGKPINAYFHANCGGHTEKIKPVWGSPDKPYLPARLCGFGKEAPWYHWKLDMSSNEILSRLKKAGRAKGSQLKSVLVKKKSQSKRAEVIIVKTNTGSYSMSGNAFRMALHPEKIRSTLWTNMTKKSGGYRFEGTGWGHGIGMCQWGARGQSLRKKNYRAILDFYYPNSKLELWHN